MGILSRLEEGYYSIIDKLVSMGIPIDKIIEPLESRGINTFKIALLLLIALVGIGAYHIYTTYLNPQHIYTFTDAYGNPLPNVKAVFFVDGARKVLYSDEEGRIRINGRDVVLEGVEYPGYMLKTKESTEDGGLRLILEPKRVFTKIKIIDAKTKTPVTARVKVVVDGEEVFDEIGNEFELCFSEARTRKCIRMSSEDSTIKITVSANGYTPITRTYVAVRLPPEIRFFLKKKRDTEREITEKDTKGTVVFRATYRGLSKPVDGVLYIASIASPSKGTPVPIKAGVSSPTPLPYGTYKIVAAQVLYDGNKVNVEILEGGAFVVDKKSVIVDIVLKPPERALSIVFKVVDKEQGQPLEAATVLLTFDHSKIEETTDDSGIATIKVSQEGCGEYVVRKDGYEPESGEVCTGTAVEVALARIIKKGDVHVLVYDPYGRPLPGANVYLTDVNENIITDNHYTDSDGEVLIRDIPVGKYKVVAEYGALVVVSEVFEVREGETAEVIIYMNPQPVETTITVLLGDLPLPGANVRLIDRDNHTIDEGNTDLSGTVTLSAPPGVPFYVHIEYAGPEGSIAIEKGPYIIPPGLTSFSIDIRIPEKLKPYAKVLKIENEEGEEVGALEIGKSYWIVMEVGYAGRQTFLFLPNHPVKIEDAMPEDFNIVNDGAVTFNLSSQFFRIEKLFIKIKVPLTYLDRVFAFDYGLKGMEMNHYIIPIGKERLCDRFFCYIFTLEDENGFEYEQGSELDLTKTYTATLILFPSRSTSGEALTVELVMETPTGERKLDTTTTFFSESNVYYLSGNLKPESDGSLTFFLIVRVPGIQKVIEKTFLGSWPVYVPDFGPVLLDINLIDEATDITYPADDIFIPGRDLRVEYKLLDQYGNEPQTPAVLTLTCGTQKYSNENTSGEILVPSPQCDEITIVATALGYSSAKVVLSSVTPENVTIDPDPQSITIEAQGSSAGYFHIETSLLTHPEIELTPKVDYYYKECNLHFVSTSERPEDIKIEWFGNACKGITRTVMVETNLFLGGGIPLGSDDFPIDITFGTVAGCLKVGIGKCKVEYNTYAILPVNIYNICDVPIPVAISDVSYTVSDGLGVSEPIYEVPPEIWPHSEINAEIAYQIQNIKFPGKYQIDTSITIEYNGYTGEYEAECIIDSTDICEASFERADVKELPEEITMSTKLSLANEDVCELSYQGMSGLEPEMMIIEGGHSHILKTTYDQSDGSVTGVLEKELLQTYNDLKLTIKLLQGKSCVVCEEQQISDLTIPQSEDFTLNCIRPYLYVSLGNGYTGYLYFPVTINPGGVSTTLKALKGQEEGKKIYIGDLSGSAIDVTIKIANNEPYTKTVNCPSVGGGPVNRGGGSNECRATGDPFEENLFTDFYRYNASRDKIEFSPVENPWDIIEEGNIFVTKFADQYTLLFTLVKVVYNAITSNLSDPIGELTKELNSLPFTNCRKTQEDNLLCIMELNNLVMVDMNIESTELNFSTPLSVEYNVNNTIYRVEINWPAEMNLGVYKHIEMIIDINKNTEKILGNEKVLVVDVNSYEYSEENKGFVGILNNIAGNRLMDELIKAIQSKYTCEELSKMIHSGTWEQGLYALYIEENGRFYDLLGLYLNKGSNCKSACNSSCWKCCHDTGNRNFHCLSVVECSGCNATKFVLSPDTEDNCVESNIVCIK